MKKAILLSMTVLALASCKSEPMDYEIQQEEAVASASVDAKHAIPGHVIIKVSDEMVTKLESSTSEDGTVDARKVNDFSNTGVISLKRLFPDAGRFEARTRAEGLHKWYIATYDEEMSTTKAGDVVSSLPGVEEMEYDYETEIVGGTEVLDILPMSATIKPAAAADLPFDDPGLSLQWHYYNKGTATSSVSGCDVNVFPVWDNYTTGNPDVIVGVVDGGIDFEHDDLKANMWHNPEKTGDAQYGYNFCNDTYQVTAEDHGTHVAGTIAAVNNNGIGVCGVAGGNSKKKQKGVKLMSCQIFEGENSGSGAAAIKWSCDHGAVISQNSWSYTIPMAIPSSLKSAVEYFVKYAGLDENGKQTGPMKGGIVIFAAGNEESDQIYGNACDDIVSVASVGADYKRAYYSNYGSWVTISAPGGDARKGNQVYSTLPHNRYGSMQGTSMACPHVSGVAALIVSNNAKQGFTSATLKNKLLSGAVSLAAFNPNYGMGKGLVNAYMSIAGTGGKAPNKPTGLEASAKSNNMKFSVTIPSDPDDHMPKSIYVYYAKADFKDPSQAAFGMFYTDGFEVGDRLEGTITGLDFNTKYYVACVACDLANNRSGLTDRVVVTTGNNNAPEIIAKGGTSISLKSHESAHLDFEINEPDEHFYEINLDTPNAAAQLDTTVREKPVVRFVGKDAPSGSYKASLEVTDMYGLKAVSEISYTILPNHAPAIAKPFENLVFNSISDTEVIDAEEYFTDEDGEELSYGFSISDNTVVNMTYADGKFMLSPMSYGYSDITITAKDVREEKAEQTFKVLIRDGSKEVDVYPNPVKDVLHIRTSSDGNFDVRIVSSSGASVYSAPLQISPFKPADINLTGKAAGVYTVIIKSEKSETRTRIVKL